MFEVCRIPSVDKPAGVRAVTWVIMSLSFALLARTLIASHESSVVWYSYFLCHHPRIRAPPAPVHWVVWLVRVMYEAP